MGYKKPLLVLNRDGNLIYQYGVKGSGPGQLGSVRDIVAPSESNDSTYVIEFDKKAIFVYINSVFIRQYPIPGEGYPRFSSPISSGNIMLDYVNSYTQAREINLTSGLWVDSSRIYTYPEGVYPNIPEGSEMDLFKGYSLKEPISERVYLFSMNTDMLQIYSNGNKDYKFISGPTGYIPKYLNQLSDRPENTFRAFGRPLSFYNDNIFVSYSGETKDKKHKQYYQSSSLLKFSLSERRYTSRLILEPDLRWNYGAFDKEREIMYIIDQNIEREGAAIYSINLADSPFFQ